MGTAEPGARTPAGGRQGKSVVVHNLEHTYYSRELHGIFGGKYYTMQGANSVECERHV